MHERPVITFAVAAGQNPGLLHALLQQLASLESSFSMEVLWDRGVSCSVGELRDRLYRRARGQWVYFLDEDCALPDGLWKSRLQQALQTHAVYSGFYLSPPFLPASGCAYNFAVNFWLKLHGRLGQPVVVGGNCLVPNIGGRGPFAGAPFGGEEVALMKWMKQHHLPLYVDSQLSVFHHAQHTWRDYLGRARLHGRSPAQPKPFWSSVRATLALLSAERSPVLTVAFFAYLGNVWLARWFR